MCLVKVLLPNEVLQCIVLLLRHEASMGIAEAVVRAGGPREVVGVPRPDMAHKLVAAAMGEWAVIHVVELISTMATGANWAMSVSCGDECGPSRSSQAAAVWVCPTVVLGTPPCHLVIGGHGGNLPWFPVKAGVGVHPQEYLHLPKVILDCHLLSIYALL